MHACSLAYSNLLLHVVIIIDDIVVITVNVVADGTGGGKASSSREGVAVFVESEEVAVHRGDLLHREENDHSMRCAATVVGDKASPERKESFVTQDLGSTIHDTTVRHLASGRVNTHVLEAGLDEIKGKREEGTAETGDGRRGHAGGHGVRVVGNLYDGLLGLIVAGKHTDVHAHTTENVGQETAPETGNTLRLGDANKGVKDVLVATTLLDGLGAVALHANKGHVEWSTDADSDGTTAETADSLLPERNVCSAVEFLQLVAEGAVETNAGSSVSSLAG